jgi:hypothetical protein
MATAPNRLQLLKRRSARMALNSRVGISGEDRQKCSFTTGILGVIAPVKNP